MEAEWEVINETTFRLRVPGGWMYRYKQQSVCFVPGPHYAVEPIVIAVGHDTMWRLSEEVKGALRDDERDTEWDKLHDALLKCFIEGLSITLKLENR